MSEAENALKCPDCDYVASNPSTLGNHRRVHGYISPKAEANRRSYQQRKETQAAKAATAARVDKAMQTAPAKAKQQNGYKCPECGRVFLSPQGLGHHRSVEHGITGMTAKRMQRRAAVALSSGQTISEPQSALLKERRTHAHPPSEIRKEEDSIPAEILAYAVGKLEAEAHHIASQNGIPAKLFTKWCAEYLSVAARR